MDPERLKGRHSISTSELASGEQLSTLCDDRRTETIPTQRWMDTCLQWQELPWKLVAMVSVMYCDVT